MVVLYSIFYNLPFMLNNALRFIQIESHFWIIHLKSYVKFHCMNTPQFIHPLKKQIFFVPYYK